MTQNTSLEQHCRLGSLMLPRIIHTAKRNIRLDQSGLTGSMRVVILPPQSTTSQTSRLKFVERFNVLNRKMNMELIIAGNKNGYKYLASKVEHLLGLSKVDTGEHIHVNDWEDRHVAMGSVGLNIRAPVEEWSRKGLGYLASLVFSKNTMFLPEDISTYHDKDEKYEEISAETSENVRI